ncbi:hypothetical protein ACWGOE_07275 [Leucobacter chromiiresistens]
MSKPRFVPSKVGFDRVRKLPATQAELLRLGGELAAEAGPGFEVVPGSPHANMARAFVQPEDGNSAARARNARDLILLRVLGSRGG